LVGFHIFSLVALAGREKCSLQEPISLMRPGYFICKIVGQSRRFEKQSFWPILLIYCPAPRQNSGTRLAAKTGMARKTIKFKALSETLGLTALNSRHPMPSTTALYLAQLLRQLRPHAFKILPSAGIRQQIAVQIEEQSQRPRVVKIIHADSN
jgi:hypothetical protein